MFCEKCQDTDCILAGEVELGGRIVYADLRLDMDDMDGRGAELDIEVSVQGEDGWVSDWTSSVKINYCPFCGNKLEV